jgi:hypothetical protein
MLADDDAGTFSLTSPHTYMHEIAIRERERERRQQYGSAVQYTYIHRYIMKNGDKQKTDLAFSQRPKRARNCPTDAEKCGILPITKMDTKTIIVQTEK